MPKSVLLCSVLLLLCCQIAAAQWVRQASGTTVRLRGVSAVNASVAWASGDSGTFLRTTDGGRTWTVGTVPGAADLDFRDVDAFDADTAYLLAIGAGERSRIYKTTDGGRSWSMQFKNTRPAAFFDCMAYWDREHGLAISDPVGGRFLVLTTADGGKSWLETPAEGMPPAWPGEGAFAASGTCVAVQGTEHAWFGTGGPAGARVFRSADRGQTWQVTQTAMTSGKTSGIFSLTFWDARHGVAVGGDYTKEREVGSNVVWTSDGGETWRLAETKRPTGFRSCVAYLPGRRAPMLIAVGPSGSDYSLSGGRSWQVLDANGAHSADFTGRPATGWAVGEGGLIMKYAAASALESK